MSSSPATKFADLCKHTTYRIGCWSCCADDTSRDLAEAFTQMNKRKDDEKSFRTTLTQSDIAPNERERLETKLEKATAQYEAWEVRLAGLRDMAAYAKQQVQRICDSTEPSNLVKEFETRAVEREEEFKQLWHATASTQREKRFIRFQSEDPGRDVSFEGLDRSSIPATPDSLISDGVGLELLVRSGRDLDQRQPGQALGEQTGPAIMSYGSALAMFGEPDAPSDDGRQGNESSAERSLEESMKAVVIVADKTEPRTEHEYRLQQGGQALTEPLLSIDQQWALFGRKKYMPYASILARQYAKLVAERTKASNKLKGKPPGEVLAADSTVSKTSTDSEGWPPVEELDWTGFTNWLHRCRKANKKFPTETLPSWDAQRFERSETMMDLLEKWKPPPDFDNGSSTHPDPKQFWSRDVPLGELEQAKLMGYNKNTSANKKKPHPPARY